jgi:sigma-E factor negative regulatory protein RseA
MMDKVNEQLSACADELPLLIERLERDKEMQARWSRYHLIGDTIRNVLPGTIVSGFHERVAAGIDEPVQAPSVDRGWIRSVGGMVVAASVALVVLFNLRVDDTGPDPTLVVPVTENPRMAEVARYAVSGGGAQWERAQPEVQAQLNAYLLDHVDRVAQPEESAEDAPQEDRP